MSTITDESNDIVVVPERVISVVTVNNTDTVTIRLPVVSVVSIEQDPYEVVSFGIQGPQGIQGPVGPQGAAGPVGDEDLIIAMAVSL